MKNLVAFIPGILDLLASFYLFNPWRCWQCTPEPLVFPTHSFSLTDHTLCFSENCRALNAVWKPPPLFTSRTNLSWFFLVWIGSLREIQTFGLRFEHLPRSKGGLWMALFHLLWLINPSEAGVVWNIAIWKRQRMSFWATTSLQWEGGNGWIFTQCVYVLTKYYQRQNLFAL